MRVGGRHGRLRGVNGVSPQKGTVSIVDVPA
jgi:hypothetical protein